MNHDSVMARIEIRKSKGTRKRGKERDIKGKKDDQRTGSKLERKYV